MLDKLPRTRYKAVAALLRAIPRAKELREVPGKGKGGSLRAQGVETRGGGEGGREAHRRRGQLPGGRRCGEAGGARCKYVAEGGWGSRRYLDTDLLNGWDEREVLKKQKG